MKKIKIEKYDEPRVGSIYTRDKYYWVWLGNGSKHRFSNRKHAEAFLARTNRFLNERVFELNRLYVEVFAEYRRLWFYFDRGAMFGNEKIENNIEWLNKKFNILIDRSGGENGNMNSFNNMRMIVDMLREIVLTLEELQKRKNNWVEKYNLAVIAARLHEVERLIEEFEKTD